MATSDDLRLVLVTPEKTLLDEPVQALRFPLFDGQIGILPGRAPLVGRLGYGELKVTNAAGERQYYVDGGFVQVKGSVVTLLTNRALPADQIKPQEAEEKLEQAQAMVPTTEVDFAIKAREQERARRMLATARNA